MESVWERRYQRLAGLLNASVWARSSDSFYRTLVDNLTDDLCCDAAGIRLLTLEGSSFFAIGSSEEISAELAGRYASLSLDTGRMGELFTTRRPITFDFLNPRVNDAVPDESENLGFRCGASTLITFQGKVLGSFDILYKHFVEHWSEEFLDYLVEIGKILGAFIEREVLIDHAIELRVLEEGKRLGAEIHDNLAQLINTAKLEVEMASIALEDGCTKRAGVHLAKAERANQLASDVIREEMVALRDAVQPQVNLVEGLGKLAGDFGERWQIQTTFSAAESLRSASISNKVTLQMLRVAHEALSNVFKHARARHVDVSLVDEGSTILLEIRDDGVGFLADEVPDERLGIRIMRERARSVQGEVRIASARGEGTTVALRVPRA